VLGIEVPKRSIPKKDEAGGGGIVAPMN